MEIKKFEERFVRGGCERRMVSFNTRTQEATALSGWSGLACESCKSFTDGSCGGGRLLFVSYNTYRNSGDFSSAPELSRSCTCNGWDTHTCLHFQTEAEAEAEYQRLNDWYSKESEARREAMLV